MDCWSCQQTTKMNMEIPEPGYVKALEVENARLLEALKKIADGGAGIGELATPLARMILMSEIAQDALEGK